MTARTARNVVDENWKLAECEFYSNGTLIANGVAGGSALSGQLWGTAAGLLASGGFQLAAELAGCNYDPGDPRPGTGQCGEVSDCGAFELLTTDRGWLPVPATIKGTPQIRKVNSFRLDPGRQCGTAGAMWYSVSSVNCEGASDGYEGCYQGNFTGEWRVRPLDGSECVDEGREPLPPGAIGRPTTIQDGDCEWTFTPIDSYIDANGVARVLWSAKPDKAECGDPYFYWSGPDGPERVAPGPDGEPLVPEPTGGGGADCCDEIMSRFNSVDSQFNEQKQRFNDIDGDLVQIMGDVSDIKNKLPDPGDDWDWTEWIHTVSDSLRILETLNDWFGTGTSEDGTFPGVDYQLAGVCEEPDAEGNQPMKTVPIVPTSGLYAVIARVDALTILLQAHLGYKTPICNEKPKLEGDWITAQWISDEPSSDSPLRLRKRTRYRSKSGRSDSELAEYFSSFTWEAGPVCVIHKGAWWGTPQVWARDIDEGKRVIRHLAGDAGIDPDQVGEWEVSGSHNPRFGRTGTMRLRTIEGFPWVSSRDGSDMLPMGDLDP